MKTYSAGAAFYVGLVLVVLGAAALGVGFAFFQVSRPSGPPAAQTDQGGAASPSEAGPAGGAPVASMESGEDGSPFSGFRFDEFSLTDQTGAAIDASVLDDRTTVVAFFFTSCLGPCPELTRIMRTIQDRTADSGLRLLSISVDGDHDTPAVLRGYAESYGADLSRWTFATGDPTAVAALSREALSFTITREADITVPGPEGTPVPNVIHPTRLLVVGPDRRVQSVHAFNDPRQIEALIAGANG